MKRAFYYETKLGRIVIAEDGTGITDLGLVEDSDETDSITVSIVIEETDLIKEAARQLHEYFDGDRIEFTVQLSPKGSCFRQKVWDALRKIPYGETRSYKQIAREVGNEKACRAVGLACHRNPILCMIPCHRVIGSDGRLTGFACGLSAKEMLLSIENNRKG